MLSRCPYLSLRPLLVPIAHFTLCKDKDYLHRRVYLRKRLENI